MAEKKKEGCRECDQFDQVALHVMLKQSRTLPLSINIYVLNAIYMYYTLAHRSECE